MDHSESAERKAGNRGVTATLALSMLLASLGTSIANIALPAMTASFGVPFHQVQWVVTAYLAAMTVSVVIVGRIGDVYGLRRTHIAGVALFSLAALLCGMAPNLWLLVGARALQGVGAAILMTLSIALARETAGEARMGRAMGLLGTVSAIGTALGPSLGGVVISAAGWQGIFLVQAPVALATLVLAAVALPLDAGEKARRPDGSSAGRMIDLLPGLMVNLLVAAVMMSTLVVGPFYLGMSLHLSAVAVGLVMSAGPLISIVTGVPSGRAVDRLGARRIVGIGLTMLAAGAFLLPVLPGFFGIAGYVIAIALLTPGYQLFQAANNTSVMAATPKERRGVVSGLLGLSRNVGLIAGVTVMGSVFAFGVGTDDFSQASSMAIANGMRLTFDVAGALMLVALWIVFGRSAGQALRQAYRS